MTTTRGTDLAGTGLGLPPSPEGVRQRGRQWRDPRLAVGALLVVGSVVGVGWVVQAADDSAPVWMVTGDVSAGNPIASGDVDVAHVRVPSGSPYLAATDPLPAGLVATRDFAAGELLTEAGTSADAGARDVRLVTLPVLRNQMPADLRVGSRVDVYVVERAASGEPAAEPRLVIGDAYVAGVEDGAGTFGGSSLELAVALQVPGPRVADVVDAQARGTVTLVDVPVGSS